MVTYNCGRHIFTGGLKEDYDVFKNRTKTDWAQVVIGGVALLAMIYQMAMLSDRFPSLLRWSWLKLLETPGEKVNGTNLNVAGATVPIFGIFFLILLIVNLPRLASYEEEMFRDGTRDWKDAVPRSIKFGLFHMLVGVPLWAALILSIPGMWFTYHYFKGGLSRSTMAHSVYNMMLATALFVILFLGAQLPYIMSLLHKH